MFPYPVHLCIKLSFMFCAIVLDMFLKKDLQLQYTITILHSTALIKSTSIPYEYQNKNGHKKVCASSPHKQSNSMVDKYLCLISHINNFGTGRSFPSRRILCYSHFLCSRSRKWLVMYFIPFALFSLTQQMFLARTGPFTLKTVRRANGYKRYSGNLMRNVWNMPWEEEDSFYISEFSSRIH